MVEPTSFPSGNLPGKIRKWIEDHPKLALTLVVLAALAPFLAKPFNIDEPLFIWTAHQIQAHPFNPYGFRVNWYGNADPMSNVTDNPPLASYCLALAAGIFGWSEIALHFAFLLPAIAVILGTHRLAQKFCRQPMLAALATLFTPVFLVSSTTVMCDVMMLAFWVWAIVLWVEGMERDDFRQLIGSALLVTFAILTKYFGACLIPLLVAYSLIENRRSRRWVVCFLIPLAALVAYQWVTRALYGRALLSDAVAYTTTFKAHSKYSEMASILIALTFTGGCVAVMVFFARLLWRWQTIFVFAILIIPLFFFENNLLDWMQGTPVTVAQIQIVFWAVCGVSVLALAAADLFHGRDARSWLLALWLLGTFSFTAFLNWTVNGRSILPMVPAVGILIARRLERNARAGWKTPPLALSACLAASAALALLVARADYLFARAAQQTALQTVAEYSSARENFLYEGHWGFQFYMETNGMTQFDLYRSVIKPGDIIALPVNNTALLPPGSAATARREFIYARGPRFLATMNASVDAGFYSSVRGTLPFALGDVSPETVYIYFLKTNTSTPAKN